MIFPLRVTLVGGGSSAHVLIPLLASAGHIVSLYSKRAHLWQRDVSVQLQQHDGVIDATYYGTLHQVSENPQEIIPESDVIILCMPVCQYRTALHEIGGFIPNRSGVFVGTVYGQAGFDWMMEEVKSDFGLDKISYFAIGLIPWICRTIAYGSTGVTFGCKAVNAVAVYPACQFQWLNEHLLIDVCERWFGKGAFVLCPEFLSISLSVDNQIIHPARCYALYKKTGGYWKNKEDIPYFYRDFDDESADVLKALDDDYTLIRAAIMRRYPTRDWKYMLSYLDLERFSYSSCNTDIKQSFVTSSTLRTIKPPVVWDEELVCWKIDTHHRFFGDDIRYGLCITKWLAERLGLATPTIDRILTWAGTLCGDTYLSDVHLHVQENNRIPYNFGMPSTYDRSCIGFLADLLEADTVTRTNE